MKLALKTALWWPSVLKKNGGRISAGGTWIIPKRMTLSAPQKNERLELQHFGCLVGFCSVSAISLLECR